ncbi:hypothetical protein QP016_06470 [Gallibacterium anatis]|uniref:hypothetical protein n=1 Tax=Gallibacterium anatis TaxID=750 RepID=UPI00254AAC12|nr:hypothetical protein [Gallibacterium anatis]MDK9430359.1 hypothetical protein [Gallibacterium anatis]
MTLTTLNSFGMLALRCVALRCVALRCVALRCVALRCVIQRKLSFPLTPVLFSAKCVGVESYAI